MRRTILALIATLLMTVTLLGDVPRVYRVTLAETTPSAIVRDIVHLYGGRLVAFAPDSGDFTLRISARAAKALAADPRVKRLTAVDSVAADSIAADDVPDITLGPYQYDGAGDISAIGTEQFVYDRDARLVSAAITPGTQTYAYDAFGNRTSAITSAGITKCNDGADCARFPHIDPGTNHFTEGQPHYDEAGDLTQLDGHQYTYDSLGLMTGQTYSTSAQYVYTADDERIAVYTSGRWKWSLRDPQGHVIRQFTSDDGPSGPASTRWTWVADDILRNGLLLASERVGSGRRHFHLDHLGTPRLVTDDAGSIVGSYEYYPFGTQPDAGNREDPAEELKFTGHQRDLASGDVHVLDYMHARYYDGAVGRFLSIDPGPYDPKDPQTWNRYTYVLNNPVDRNDPTGRCPWCVGGLVGGIVGVVGAGIHEVKTSLHQPVTWSGSTKRVLGAFAGGFVSGAAGTVCPTCGGAVRFSAAVYGTVGGGVVNRAISGQKQTLDAVQRDAIGGSVGFVAGEAGAKLAGAAAGQTVENLKMGAAAARADAAAQSLGQGADKVLNQAIQSVKTVIKATGVATSETASNITSSSLPHNTVKQDEPHREESQP